MDSKKRILLEQFLDTMSKIRRFVDKLSPVNFQNKMATILQIHALTFLKENPKSTVGKLGKYLAMSSSSITQLTERLVKDNWVKRTYNPKDRRIVHISLTESGENQLRQMRRKRIEKMSRFLSYMPEKDLKEIVRIHTSLLEKLEEKER